MTEILKPGGSGSRRPPSHPSSGRHSTRTTVTPTRGNVTKQWLLPAGPLMDPIVGRNINVTLDQIHGQGQRHRQGGRFTGPF
jgi:hypothetical protein